MGGEENAAPVMIHGPDHALTAERAQKVKSSNLGISNLETKTSDYSIFVFKSQITETADSFGGSKLYLLVFLLRRVSSSSYFFFLILSPPS